MAWIQKNPLRISETHFGKPFHSLVTSNDLTERHKGGKWTCPVFPIFTVNAHEQIQVLMSMKLSKTRSKEEINSK